MHIRLGSPGPLAERLAALAGAPLTYAEEGATADAVLPAGYHHLRRSQRIGHGEAAYVEALRRLTSWEFLRRAGLRIATSTPTVEVGSVVVQAMRLGPPWLGPVWIEAPCRVVRVSGEPRRGGFAYGTLPGHPERGEESFEVALADDGAVHATITSFSRGSSPLVRAGGPVKRVVQRRAVDRYLRALSEP